MAGPKPQEASVRVYDRDHRDYHNWDDREDHAYRRYLGVQRRTYRGYERQTPEHSEITGVGATVIRTTIKRERPS
jgi:hypothetical protein